MAEGLKKFDLPAADAIVVGSGPNGLAAAIRIAQAGHSVVVLESAATIGGGMRSAELTLPGFLHDVCSSVHPMAVSSPYFQTLPLQSHGLEWVHPQIPLAHPFDDGSATALFRSVDETAATLGTDGNGYKALVDDFADCWDELLEDALAPVRVPRHPVLISKFGKRALRSARGLTHAYLRTERARALLGGIAAHSTLPLEKLLTGGFALVLAIAGHARGWPFARGGSQTLANALISLLHSLGGQVISGVNVESIDQLPPAKAVLLDVTPRQLLAMAGHKLPDVYQQRLKRYRYSMGVFKMDWVLHQPVPWRAPECQKAGTVHLGSSFQEISESERKAWHGEIASRPLIIFAQPTITDPSRAPSGKHIAWAYCHVPNGCTVNMVEAIENQVERFAPGFRDCIMARSVMAPAELEQRNPNLVGGDISGGASTPEQFFFRPTATLYKTPARGLYLCSSSTPPGGGVHGMCGYYAAEMALAGI
jgi:phytoene dehydrogenase-like protein